MCDSHKPNIKEISKLLKKTLYFSKIPLNELETIAKIMVIEEYKKGDVIFYEHEEGDCFYIIDQGKVEISIESEDGGKKILSIKNPMDGFGELSIIDNQTRSATVKCLEDTKVLKLSKKDFENLVDDIEGFTYSLAFVLTNIVRNNTDIIITDLKERNKILQHSVTQLQELQDKLIRNERIIAVGKFANKMVHDLKNMLNQISSAIQILAKKKALKSDDFDEKTEEYFGLIHNAVGQMNELCIEVLEFSQGKVSINKELVSVSRFLKEFILKISDNLRSHNISFEKKIDSKHNVLLDRNKMERVLTNIIYNSVDALENTKSPKIHLNCYDKMEQKNNDKEKQVIIEVSDNGKGITEDNKKMIFEPFYTSGKSHGTGLGMTISKEIITMHHGGKIYLESEEGKGTTITIELPAK